MTAFAAVIGDPVAHSLSPAIHNAAFAATHVDARFEAVVVPEGQAPAAVRRMRSEHWLGMSVTMPHKSAVAAALDGVTDIAASLDAVNCVFRDGDRLIGDNTDGAGVLWSLRTQLCVSLDGARVAVLGAGGAARACIAALATAGVAEVLVVNRTASRAERAAALAPGVGRVATADDLPAADVVVNATPMGMEGSTAASPAFVPEAGSVALDLVYHPLRTAWMDRAEANGARVANGVGMLVGQAAAAFERWTHLPAPTDVMWAAVAEHLGD